MPASPESLVSITVWGVHRPLLTPPDPAPSCRPLPRPLLQCQPWTAAVGGWAASNRVGGFRQGCSLPWSQAAIYRGTSGKTKCTQRAVCILGGGALRSVLRTLMTALLTAAFRQP